MGRGEGDNARDDAVSPRSQADPEVKIAPHDETSRKLWKTIFSIAEQLNGEWTLVGGLMVQLHAYANSVDVRTTDVRTTTDVDILVRTTTDIDILANSRTVPSSTEEISRSLMQLGFTQLPPTSVIRPDVAFVYERDEQQVDVLAPDGVDESKPKTSDGTRTVPIPGGSQALKRSIPMRVVMDDGSRATVRAPTLLGAILIKARALPVHDDPEAQRQDLVSLLSYVKDPLEMRGELSKAEAKWLRTIEDQLNFDDPFLARIVPAADVARAKATFQLLISS